MGILTTIKETITATSTVTKENHRYDVQFKHQDGKLLELIIRILSLQGDTVIAPTVGDEIRVDTLGRLYINFNNKDEIDTHFQVYKEILAEVNSIITSTQV